MKPEIKTILFRLLFADVIILLFNTCTNQESKFPFQDPNLSIEERVNDLVGRMTLDEKIGQMMNAAPAIDRLGIPEYNWWNECLHGVARAGLATVYPQAIGLGATWDEDMMFRVANSISDEARAKHHEFERKNKRLIYQGLTFWSPNINIFRDPRWGRGQETYGEDPYLTGRMAVNFIKGLQGDDPKYFKTIATVKHFAVHSGPEPERHSFDARIDEKDLRETYLPQFEMGIKEGKAYSVMCAYNRLDGEACCGSNHLLVSILRNEWKFPGYVVSDCGAIGDIYQNHKIVSTAEEASALAVKAGCDLECATTYQSLKKAIEEKIISEEEINVAVKRLFTARFKLGMFDPPSMVKWASIPYSVVDSKQNHELALEAARKSIVLLKNENNLLPLKKDLKTVAVIGPNADQWQMLLGNYNGLPSNPVTPFRGICDKLSASGTKVLYAQGCELAEGLPTFEKIPASVLYHGNEHGLLADYYNNKDFTDKILFSTADSAVDKVWGDGAPRKDMNDDNFGVRWTGEIIPEKTGDYQLGIITTCKVNLYLNDTVIVKTTYHFRDEFNDPRLRKSVSLHLEAGKKYKLKLEAGESYGDARVQLVWAGTPVNVKEEMKKQAIDMARQSDVVIMCMGLSARLEGEEMDIKIDGFKGGDRTSLDLPRPQEDLLKEIKALGKPVILVLMSGSAVAINWENQNLPAIIEAWYPGQAAGTAIADVLFGDYNPAGRLPVTFYKSVNDLPSFEDYNITTQTYRYFKGDPIYPFGYGLSYSNFTYENLKANYQPGQPVKISVNLKNTGSRDGDEVAEVYVSNKTATTRVPIRALAGFKRVHLIAGETKTVELELKPDAFASFDEKGQKKNLPGKFEITIGGGQPDVKLNTSSNVLKTEINIQ
jgi:beta-glucosidase